MSYSQLRGTPLTTDTAADCSPVIYNKDLKVTTRSVTGLDLVPEDIAFPCGIAARSVFNDTFTMSDKIGTNIEIKDDNIAWKDDKEFR